MMDELTKEEKRIKIQRRNEDIHVLHGRITARETFSQMLTQLQIQMHESDIKDKMRINILDKEIQELLLLEKELI